MKQKRLRTQSTIVRRKNKIGFVALVCGGILLIGLTSGEAIRYFLAKNSAKARDSAENLELLWNQSDYLAVYEQTSRMLEQKPIQQLALVYRGYSSFYLAVSQTDTASALSYIEESINALRIALSLQTTKAKGQIEYMLAKAYFQKNAFSSYNYYGDLVVKYFTLAQKDGFFADDIPEYLGITYASLGQSSESIAAFTEALAVRESDTLLNAIGEQYFVAGDFARAKQYLFRVVSESSDDLLILKSRNILGKIYLEENNLFEAKKEFDAILEKDPNYADAYYGLGVIYEKQGDLIKARSEWRKTLRVQVNHQLAIQKLNNG